MGASAMRVYEDLQQWDNVAELLLAAGRRTEVSAQKIAHDLFGVLSMTSPCVTLMKLSLYGLFCSASRQRWLIDEIIPC